MITFAADKPIDYHYDRSADVLYVEFAHAKAARSLKLLGDFPLLLLDLDGQDRIVGIEFAGATRFNDAIFKRLFRSRVLQKIQIRLPGGNTEETAVGAYLFHYLKQAKDHFQQHGLGMPSGSS
jgi:uncharacterized protein YuzE